MAQKQSFRQKKKKTSYTFDIKPFPPPRLKGWLSNHDCMSSSNRFQADVSLFWPQHWILPGKSLESTFVFNDAELTWRNAQLYCRRKHVDLAYISDGFENSALVQLFPPKYSQSEAWIGLSKNLWLWSDQSKVSWTSVKWAEGQPDNTNGKEKCGFVRETGLIGDEDCLHPLPFFCSEFYFCFNS